MRIKHNKIFIITAVSVVILASITTISYAGIKASKKMESTAVGNEYKEKVLDKQKNDNVIAYVNKDSIKESEISYAKIQNPKLVNDTDALIKIVAINKLLLTEANENDSKLSEEEKQNIINVISDSFDKNLEENQEFLKSSGLTKEQAIEMLADNQINGTIQARYLAQNVLPKLLKDDFFTPDENLKKAVANLKSLGLTDSSTMKSVLDAYKDSIYLNANVTVKK